MTPLTIHVRHAEHGIWAVYVNGGPTAASEHATASEAERTATQLARAVPDDAEVVVFDAYNRCRPVPVGQLRMDRGAPGPTVEGHGECA